MSMNSDGIHVAPTGVDEGCRWDRLPSDSRETCDRTTFVTFGQKVLGYSTKSDDPRRCGKAAVYIRKDTLWLRSGGHDEETLLRVPRDLPGGGNRPSGEGDSQAHRESHH